MSYMETFRGQLSRVQLSEREFSRGSFSRFSGGDFPVENCPRTEIKRGCYFVLLLLLLVKICAASFNVNMTNHSQDITKKQVTIILHKQTLLCKRILFKEKQHIISHFILLTKVHYRLMDSVQIQF